jgi:putative hemolysin
MAIELVIIVFAAVGSFLISMSEAAVLAVSKIRVRHLAGAGDQRANRILWLTARPERFFGALLLTNNMVNMLLGALITSLAIRVWGNTGGVVAGATLVSTAVLVVFCELTPKTIAVAAAERVSLLVATPVHVLARITAPVVWVFTLFPRAMNRIFGWQGQSSSPTVTPSELRMLIDVGEAEGTVERGQGAMLENVFRFGETEVRAVMTPRTGIVWVHAETTLREFTETYHLNPHTHYPVFDEDHDDVVGVLSVKDVLAALSAGNLDWTQPVSLMAREAYFVAETRRLDDLFRTLQQSGHKMAIVVDEFGGVTGLMTLNQVLEQVVGRTGEEGATPGRRFVAIGDNTYMVEGGMPVRDANEALGLSLPEGQYKTLAGYILDNLQRVPAQGDRLRVGDFRLQVAEMDGNRITRVRIRRRSGQPAPEQAETASAA